MSEPVGNVKGATFAGSWDILHALVEAGTVSEEALEVQLSAEAFTLYEEKVSPSLWYPILVVEEILQQLVNLNGHGDPDHMRVVGAQVLKTFLERDSYRHFIEGAMKQKGSEGPTLVKLASLVYDFGVWEFEGEDLTLFTATITEAQLMPVLAPYSIAGFMEALVKHCAGYTICVGLQRPLSGKIVFKAVKTE
jgi:hypothetical protein